MLKDKVILILSPQAWGKMFVSKHHYAVELANAGNTVYFLDPPGENDDKSGLIHISDAGIHSRVKLIRHKLWFPYNLKFHALPVFHFFIKSHIRRILSAIGKPVDIVWSFDLGNIYPFRFFPSSALRVFHPVDEPRNRDGIESGSGAEVIFSVTKEILSKYAHFNVPMFLVNHGVNKVFTEEFVENTWLAGNSIRVGISGNLLRNDIDREVLLKIIRENSSVIFEFWGSYHLNDANIGGGDDAETRKFIEDLQSMPNVILHGAVNTETLAREFNRMDAFLICYDVMKDQSKGTNYHKVMEYLATGRVIISNNISAYQGNNQLLYMANDRTSNEELPELFRGIIGDLSTYNSFELIKVRSEFACANTYARKIIEIDGHLEKVKNDRI
jgi:glycosyltransferase involved in cell wall biosynthesis